MLTTKKRLTVNDIESQAVRVLPNREMLALVNVTIFDLLNNNTVVLQLPVGVAANVCGVDANVLATQAASGGASCSATATNGIGALNIPRAFLP